MTRRARHCPSCHCTQPPKPRNPAHPADDVLDDWDELRRQGYSIRDAADRLGMTTAALDQVITRGARKGDPRAQRPRRLA